MLSDSLYSISSLSKYLSISSELTSVPRSLLYLSGSNGSTFSSGFTGNTSTIPPTTSPAPSSSISSHALLIAASALYGSSPFSNLPDASVLRPAFFAEILMLAPSKHAASKSIVLTSSVILEFSPPMIPASPIAFSPSHIISIDESRVLSCPSRVQKTSLSLALLTTILWSAIVS